MFGTDLDKFSQLEITELMRHGYYITAQVLASERGVLMPLPIPKWDIPEGSWAKTTAPHAIARNCKAVPEGGYVYSRFAIG